MKTSSNDSIDTSISLIYTHLLPVENDLILSDFMTKLFQNRRVTSPTKRSSYFWTCLVFVLFRWLLQPLLWWLGLLCCFCKSICIWCQLGCCWLTIKLNWQNIFPIPFSSSPDICSVLSVVPCKHTVFVTTLWQDVDFYTYIHVFMCSLRNRIYILFRIV